MTCWLACCAASVTVNKMLQLLSFRTFPVPSHKGQTLSYGNTANRYTKYCRNYVIEEFLSEEIMDIAGAYGWMTERSGKVGSG